jgi:hypothetical protein
MMKYISVYSLITYIIYICISSLTHSYSFAMRTITCVRIPCGLRFYNGCGNWCAGMVARIEQIFGRYWLILLTTITQSYWTTFNYTAKNAHAGCSKLISTGMNNVVRPTMNKLSTMLFQVVTVEQRCNNMLTILFIVGRTALFNACWYQPGTSCWFSQCLRV